MPFEHAGMKYKVGSYFYRVEFQARGASHLHCMFWLVGENGEVPSTLFSEEVCNPQAGAKLAEFAKSVMHGSIHKIRGKISKFVTPEV